MSDMINEAARAVIWTLVGIFPVMFGLAVHMWADIRSLKKAMNAAFVKIRKLETGKDTCGRESQE